MFVSILATLAVTAAAEESDFYARFKAANELQSGFLWGAELVQTNNVGPILTNVPVSWFKLAGQGELAGVKLGMTMSEVVSQWGKPHLLFTYCGIGPRFWYGAGPKFGDISLSFRSNVLVRIAISGRRAEHVQFDNGLAGKMGQREFEELLGSPSLRQPDPSEGLFIGDIAYRTDNIRTDIAFAHVSTTRADELTWPIRHIAVCLECEAVRHKSVEK